MPSSGYKSVTITKADHARLIKIRDQMRKEFDIKVSIGQTLSYLINQYGSGPKRKD